MKTEIHVTRCMVMVGLLSGGMGCATTQTQKKPETVKTMMAKANTYEQDLAFLKKHSDAIELKNADGEGRVCLVPAWQGRVMTSATSGDGTSFGWMDYDLIKAGVQPKDQREGLTAHLYVFGGEERFWIGPEGGQFSSFFAPNTEFDFENWFVPPFIDTEPWKVMSKDNERVALQHRIDVSNWSGHVWKMQVDREVAILSRSALADALGQALPKSVKAVAHETSNTIVNKGEKAWDETTGMPSIWILGMMKHGPETTVAIPFATGGEDLGKVVTDDYFGKVPAERLVVDVQDGVLYFKADGTYRSKIGISPQRSKGVAGSWNPLNNVLTIVQYNQPDAGTTKYVNSQWKKQDEPFVGDAINSYNDGPIGDDQLGPFYEIETSSPALALGPGESYTHVHRTIHLEGAPAELDGIAKAIFGVDLSTIEEAIGE